MPVYNKLVRDFIPDIIDSQGKLYSIRTLLDEEYYAELRKKLHEEYEEYLTATNDKDAVHELADLLEVVYALASIHGVTEQDLNHVRNEKAVKRRGFKERILLIEAEE